MALAPEIQKKNIELLQKTQKHNFNLIEEIKAYEERTKRSNKKFQEIFDHLNEKWPGLWNVREKNSSYYLVKKVIKPELGENGNIQVVDERVEPSIKPMALDVVWYNAMEVRQTAAVYTNGSSYKVSAGWNNYRDYKAKSLDQLGAYVSRKLEEYNKSIQNQRELNKPLIKARKKLETYLDSLGCLDVETWGGSTFKVSTDKVNFLTFYDTATKKYVIQDLKLNREAADQLARKELNAAMPNFLDNLNK